MDKLFEDSDYSCERYICNCMGHALDVSVEKTENSTEVTFSNECLGHNSRTFLERVKIAFKYILNFDKKHHGYFWEFCLREDDIPHLIKLLKSHS